MTDAAAYQVLARKYRPQVFADLVGQEALVRTLTNAFNSDRIAHAFMLTGVRGVGKTTTARIIARGLNCEGPDGKGGITATPCGVCGPCRAIAEGRHVDVLEMDAATHTQVDRMRELLASVPYRPAEGRMKVYIIDEVHMLSTASFNALLKTLEEPPKHVKFIFATTEIRKVPVTVLSRCQRFDLRRIEPEVMVDFLTGIAAREGAEITPDALALIARAAEGSARDALSLLDQAIAHGAGGIDRESVRLMLGLADRGRVLDLFDLIMRGEVAGALAELSAQYAAGADPMAVLRDLAETTHWISVVKVAPTATEDPTVTPEERRRGADLAQRLPVPALARTWQMLLRALDEVARAPNAMMAAEMAVIRLTHVADMPPPAELMRQLTEASGESAARAVTPTRPSGQLSSPTPTPSSSIPPVPTPPIPTGGSLLPATEAEAPPRAAALSAAAVSPGTPVLGAPAPTPVSMRAGEQHSADRAEPLHAVAPAPAVREALPARFEDAVSLIRGARDMRLLMSVEQSLRLVGYAPGRIEFQPTPDAPTSLAGDLARRLDALTGQRWSIVVAATGGGPTLAEMRQSEAQDLRSRVAAHPLVAAALEAFPGAEIRDVRPVGAPDPGDAGLALEEDAAAQYVDPEDVPDDWDPFDIPGEEE